MTQTNPAKPAASLAIAALLLSAAGCQTHNGDSQESNSRTFDRAVLLLKEQYESADPAIRANCVEALEMANDPRAVEMIEGGLHDSAWVVRFASTMAAGKRNDKQVAPVIRSMIVTDPSDSVRVACVYALRRMGDSSNMKLIPPALSSPDPSTRAYAALVLGLMGDASALPLLVAHAKDGDVRVRFQITAAMARLGDPAAQKVVVSWAVSEYAEDQWNAMMVCADLPEDIASWPLSEGLKGIPPSAEKQVTPEQRDLTIQRQLIAARSLAKLGSLEGSKIAVPSLTNANPNIRALAALALGEILSAEHPDRVARLMEDPDPNVRRAAAAAIVRIFVRSGLILG